MNTELQDKKLRFEKAILSLMPLELWRLVDSFTDAKSHTILRASCSFFRTWLTWEKDVEFDDYVQLVKKVDCGVNWMVGLLTFQSAIHLNSHTLKQEHYGYLCKRRMLFHELLRICSLALQEPFTCAHIDLSANDSSAIIVASEFGHIEKVKLLLQYPRVDPFARRNRAIRMASQNGHRDVVELLLQDPRVDPAAWENEIFIIASSSGRLAVVQLLLQDPRVDPSSRHHESIRMASRNGHLAIVELLLQDPRIDPAANVYGNEAIRNASQYGHGDVVELLLLDPRVDPSAHKNVSLRAASAGKHAAVCSILLADDRVLAAYRVNPFELPVCVHVPDC